MCCGVKGFNLDLPGSINQDAFISDYAITPPALSFNKDFTLY